MNRLLDGKVAIITGACSGIGLASARLFALHGAKVMLADIDATKGADIAAAIGGGARFKCTDVGVDDDIEALVDETVASFGRLDVMYNNAGITGDASSMFDIGGEGFDAVMGVDARSVMMGHRFAALQFRKQGGGGSIITTASVAAIEGGWAPVGYTTAKHAVLGIVRQASAELAPFGIRSNALAPWVIMTGIQSKAYGVPPVHAAEYEQYLVSELGGMQPMGRFGFPDDVAKVALFLASDLASYVSGAVIPVDGGGTATTQFPFAREIDRVTQAFRDLKGT